MKFYDDKNLSPLVELATKANIDMSHEGDLN